MRSGAGESATIRAASRFNKMSCGQSENHLRRSGTKLNIAVVRRRVVATSGRESAFLTWVSIVRRAVLPTLSTD